MRDLSILTQLEQRAEKINVFSLFSRHSEVTMMPISMILFRTARILDAHVWRIKRFFTSWVSLRLGSYLHPRWTDPSVNFSTCTRAFHQCTCDMNPAWMQPATKQTTKLSAWGGKMCESQTTTEDAEKYMKYNTRCIGHILRWRRNGIKSWRQACWHSCKEYSERHFHGRKVRHHFQKSPLDTGNILSIVILFRTHETLVRIREPSTKTLRTHRHGVQQLGLQISSPYLATRRG